MMGPQVAEQNIAQRQGIASLQARYLRPASSPREIRERFLEAVRIERGDGSALAADRRLQDLFRWAERNGVPLATLTGRNLVAFLKDQAANRPTQLSLADDILLLNELLSRVQELNLVLPTDLEIPSVEDVRAYMPVVRTQATVPAQLDLKATPVLAVEASIPSAAPHRDPPDFSLLSERIAALQEAMEQCGLRELTLTPRSWRRL